MTAVRYPMGLAALLLVVAGCGDSGATERTPSTTAVTAAPATGDFWPSVRITGDESEGYATLAEMAAAADAVVVGTFSSAKVSRTLQGDAAEDVVVYMGVTLDVREILHGSVPGDSVLMEFLLPVVGAADAATVVTQLAAGLPSGDLLVFLRDKRGAEAGLYRAVNSFGVWAETERALLDTPLAEGPAADVGMYADVVESAGSVAGLVEIVRGY